MDHQSGRASVDPLRSLFRRIFRIGKTGKDQRQREAKGFPANLIKVTEEAQVQMGEPSLLNLPDHLVDLIFVMCSVKTLLRIRCVCKSWQSRIDDPQFRSFHISFQRKNLALLGSDRKSLRLLQIEQHTLSLFTETLSFPLQGLGLGGIIVAGCNGLICIRSYSTCYVVNPATRQSLRLPQFPFRVNDRLQISELAFDASSASYKMLLGYIDNVQILNVGKKYSSWRRLGHICGVSTVDFLKSPMTMRSSVAGAIHWICERECHIDQDCIVAFDICTEKFRIMSYPKCCPGDDFCRKVEGDRKLWRIGRKERLHEVFLAEKEGMLRFLHFFDGFPVNMDMWVLKEYKNMDTWVKEYRVGMEYFPRGVSIYIGMLWVQAFSDMLLLNMRLVQVTEDLDQWMVFFFHPDRRRFFCLETKARNNIQGGEFGSSFPYFESLAHWDQLPRRL